MSTNPELPIAAELKKNEGYHVSQGHAEAFLRAVRATLSSQDSNLTLSNFGIHVITRDKGKECTVLTVEMAEQRLVSVAQHSEDLTCIEQRTSAALQQLLLTAKPTTKESPANTLSPALKYAISGTPWSDTTSICTFCKETGIRYMPEYCIDTETGAVDIDKVSNLLSNADINIAGTRVEAIEYTPESGRDLDDVLRQVAQKQQAAREVAVCVHPKQWRITVLVYRDEPIKYIEQRLLDLFAEFARDLRLLDVPISVHPPEGEEWEEMQNARKKIQRFYIPLLQNSYGVDNLRIGKSHLLSSIEDIQETVLSLQKRGLQVYLHLQHPDATNKASIIRKELKVSVYTRPNNEPEY